MYSEPKAAPSSDPLNQSVIAPNASPEGAMPIQLTEFGRRGAVESRREPYTHLAGLLFPAFGEIH